MKLSYNLRHKSDKGHLLQNRRNRRKKGPKCRQCRKSQSNQDLVRRIGQGNRGNSSMTKISTSQEQRLLQNSQGHSIPMISKNQQHFWKLLSTQHTQRSGRGPFRKNITPLLGMALGS